MRDVQQDPFTGFERDLDLDLVFREATEEAASEAIVRLDHTLDHSDKLSLPEAERKVAMKGLYAAWNYETIITPELLYKSLDPQRPRISQGQALAVGINLSALYDGMQTFAITEAGIVWFPQDVENTSNPQHNQAPELQSKDPAIIAELHANMSPHDKLPRLWVPQEYQHLASAERLLVAHGVDMVAFNTRRMIFQTKDATPKPINTARGLAYTEPQEGNTVAPYAHVSKTSRKLQRLASLLGYEVEAELWGATAEIYELTKRDEANHKAYFKANRVAAMNSGGALLRSYVLGATADELGQVDRKGRPVFDMPAAQSDPGFAANEGIIAAEGLFDATDAFRNVASAIRTVNPEDDSNLTTLGQEAAEYLVGHLARIDQTLQVAARYGAKNGRAHAQRTAENSNNLPSEILEEMNA